MCRSVPTPGLANVLGAAVLGTAVLGAPGVVPAPAGATIGAAAPMVTRSPSPSAPAASAAPPAAASPASTGTSPTTAAAPATSAPATRAPATSASVTPTSTTPTAGPSGTAGRSPAERRRDEALPRWLLWSMAGLAFLGVLVGFGSASHTLRPRDEHYDRFIG